jgi:hypothetical protein
MFGLLNAIVEVVKLPVDVAADVITMGGAMTDKDKPYTVKRCERVMRKLNED